MNIIQVINMLVTYMFCVYILNYSLQKCPTSNILPYFCNFQVVFLKVSKDISNKVTTKYNLLPESLSKH